MRALVGCEFSAVVRDALRAVGVDAYSCDLLPCEGDSRWHIQGDVLDVLDDGWDLGIFHPHCTYLANSGVKHLHITKQRSEKLVGPARWVAMFEGAEFFNALWRCRIPRVAIENPIPHKYARTLVGRYSQTIQPYQFGHPETKRTCLWLRGLPKLVETNNVKHLMRDLPKSETDRVHMASPRDDRWKERSRTLPGIAWAMAAQWAAYVRRAGGEDRCGAFGTTTGRTCILETDHHGPHMLEAA